MIEKQPDSGDRSYFILKEYIGKPEAEGLSGIGTEEQELEF